MKVAFYGRSLATPVLRGWDRYTVGLVKELVASGVEVALFHRAREPLNPKHTADLGCEVVGLPDRSGVHWEQVVVPRALKRGGFDIFHAPTEYGVPFFAPCPTALTYHSATVPSYKNLIEKGLLQGKLTDYIGKEYVTGSRFAHWYHNTGIARATHILTPSEFCRREMIELLGIAPQRVTTTPLAVHEQFNRPPSSPQARAQTLAKFGVKRPYALYVGGYEKHKNVEGLLNAFALARAERSDLSLVCVGSKSVTKQVRERARSLRLEEGDAVLFLTNLTDELTDLYDAAEVFVTLSWRETFCLPALEAMTRGAPVVASAWGATPEILDDAGYTVDPRDYRAASELILRACAPGGEREAKIAAGKRRAQFFSWKTTAALTIEIYEKLLRAKKRRGAPSANSRAESSYHSDNAAVEAEKPREVNT